MTEVTPSPAPSRYAGPVDRNPATPERSARADANPDTDAYAGLRDDEQPHERQAREDALVDLWQRFHGELFGFLRSRGTDEALADDLLQSAFLRAHARLSAGDRPEQPRAWLYQIVRNLMRDAWRSRRRAAALDDALESEVATHEDDPEVPHEIGSDASSGNSGDEAFLVVARALPAFIEELSEPYRQALRLTELEGLTQAEAAHREKVSVTAMKSRVQRGRRQVFDALQACCRFEVDRRGHLIACSPRDGSRRVDESGDARSFRGCWCG